MAITKLQLYNLALSSLGGRRLAATTDDVEARYTLDDFYDAGAADFCLEVGKPVFARKTATLNTPATSSAHDLDEVHTLPADYVAMVAVYSDSKLEQEIERYIIEGGTLACEYSTIYIRYVSNGYSLDDWTPAFSHFVAAYLAKSAGTRLDEAGVDRLDGLYQQRLQALYDLNDVEEPPKRADASTFTLSSTYLAIYNDALLILGLPKITNVNDDSQRRSVLDTAMNASLVESFLEDTGWTFGRTTTKLEYNSGVEPEFGYRRAFDKPASLLRIHGLFQDEYLRHPLKHYEDEGSYFFADVDEFYIQYVSTSFLTEPQNWPAYFRKAIAGRLALEAGPALPGANYQNAVMQEERRTKSAMSNDAVASPPRIIAEGNWVRSRNRSSSHRGRP